jgi:hypothetical protein
LLANKIELEKSIEGDEDEAWPTSPPLQQLSLERINDAPVILDVGAAGTGHWSISLGLEPDDPSASKFDLACRCPQPPTFLGSRYQLSKQLSMQALGEQVQVHNEAATITATIPVRESDTYQWSYRIAPAK